MQPMKFKPITLPTTALRRSWLIQRADERCNFFARLMAKLDPVWKVQYTHGRLSAYYSLLTYLDQNLFPVFESELEIYEDEGFDPLEYAQSCGIPTDLYGRDYESRFDDSRRAAFSAVEWFSMCSSEVMQPDSYTYNIDHYPALKPVKQHLLEFKGLPFQRRALKPGRDQVWIEPWAALPDLIKYVEQNTGLYWLDVSHEDMAESGSAYPMWSIGDIRALAREWQRAKVIWERIVRLVDYIDAQPADRLWLLLAVLSGNRDAKDDVTRYKPQATRTLAEVWNV
jgi:hypothetical protein